MALRRLLSGWLIAVAALARSMALVLERAAVDRSGPTPLSVPGPVMAALAERYPGAPDHWLALVAERTSRLAEAGEAPLSLTSQPSAWPSSLPGAAGPLAPLMPTAPDGDEALLRDPVRSAEQGAFQPSARPDAIPSLAALQGRSSEVWRRPEASRGRRPRPVFAPVEPVPPRAESTLESRTATGARSRSSLTLEARPTFSSRSTSPSLTSPGPIPPGKTPPPVASPSESVARDRVRSAAIEKPGEASFATPSPKPIPTSPATGLEVASRAEPHSRLADASPAAPSASRPVLGETLASAPSDRDMSVFATPIDAAPRRAASPSAERSIDVASAQRPAFSAVPTRPAARRSIFGKLAALGSGRRAAPVRHPQVMTRPALSGTVAALAEFGPDQGVRPLASHPHVSPTASSAATAPHVMESKGQEPSASAKFRPVVTPTPRRPDPTWASSFAAEDFANDEAPRDRRAGFAISRPSSATAGIPKAPEVRADDRWPRFPPGLFTPPAVAEIPSSRLDQLAREQEEGRWSV